MSTCQSQALPVLKDWHIAQIYSGLTLCGRNTTGGFGCQSAVLFTLGLNYSKVCGQLKGYQVGSPNAFEYTYWSDGGQDTNEQGKSQAKVRVKLTAQMLGWYNNCRDGTTVSFHISAV